MTEAQVRAWGSEGVVTLQREGSSVTHLIKPWRLHEALCGVNTEWWHEQEEYHDSGEFNHADWRGKLCDRCYRSLYRLIVKYA